MNHRLASLIPCGIKLDQTVVLAYAIRKESLAGGGEM
jgi:hypothetical protein